MSDLIPSQFVSPSPRSELNGELGLDLHEIAKSLGAEFKEIKRVFEKNINDYSAVEFSTLVEGGFAGPKEVKSYVLSVEDAKFFVAGYNNEVGKAYRRWLIQCEKKLDQTTLLINGMMSDETICRRVLQLADEKQNALIAERDHAIETKAHINDKKIASVLGQWGHLKAELKKHKIPTEAKALIKQKTQKVYDALGALDIETQTRVQELVKTEPPKPVYVDANDWFRAQKQTAAIHTLPPKGTISLWRFLYLHSGISFNLTFEVRYEAAMAMAETETMFIVEEQTKPSNGAPPKTIFTPYFHKGAYDEYFTNQDLLGHLKATLGKLVYRGVDVSGDLFTAHLTETPPDPIEF
jgi:phage anti-repressor protein